jgi:hypothetical protein
MPRQLAPERGHDPEHVEARTMAVIEDCERVDRLGVESGLIDPDDPLYRRERRLFGQMRRESRSRRAYWQRRRRFAGAPNVQIPQRRESVARPREHRSRSRTRQASRAGPDDPSELEPPPVALLRGFTAASERLSRHLQRRAGARRFA